MGSLQASRSASPGRSHERRPQLAQFPSQGLLETRGRLWQRLMPALLTGRRRLLCLRYLKSGHTKLFRCKSRNHAPQPDVGKSCPITASHCRGPGALFVRAGCPGVSHIVRSRHEYAESREIYSMGDKNPKTAHKQAVQKQAKVDDAKQKKVATDAAKQVEKGK